ncbi:MAG: nitroreductase family protein, partial [Acetatifactor muris]|nr:nitroreductase family protein [Acetatifactor muris]
MSEIDAMKNRHSVRTYQPKRIEQEKIDKLNAMISDCNEKGNLHLQFIEDAGKTFNRLLNKAMGLGTAPSLIACVGHVNDTLDERIGYYGERIVLYAQELGLNTCWAGTFNAKNVTAEIFEGEKLIIVIAIGYGVDPGRQH